MKTAHVSIFFCLVMMPLASLPVNAQIPDNVSLGQPEPTLSEPIYDIAAHDTDITKRLVGQYSFSFGSRSPEGSATLALLDNHKYVMASFGTVLVGDWRVVKDQYLHLLPYRTAHPFLVFGRRNVDLAADTKVMFDGDDFGYDTLIHYGALNTDTPTLTPIFNKDANCFSSPYETKSSGTYDTVSLAFNPDYQNQGDSAIDIYSFDNSKRFNDLIVLNLNELASQSPIKAVIDGDELVFEQGRTKRHPLPKATSEDAQFYKEVTDTKPLPKTLYYNLAGRSWDSQAIHKQAYTFDKSLNAYVSNTKCETDCLADDDYHNADTLYRYQALETITQQQSTFQIAEQSAVYSVCED